MHHLLRGVVLTLIVLLLSVSAHAAQDLEKNIALLRSASDFRVRTQAALALGASKSTEAVSPLCGALVDQNRTVRIAAATALSRLKRGGKKCLMDRLAVETEPRVLAALKRALLNLGDAEPLLGPQTKFWVAVQKVAGPDRLDEPVRAAMVKAARGRQDVAFAPAELSSAEARKQLSEYPDATGFLLAPKLARPQYEGGMLKVKMSVAIMSYPGNNLLGSFSKTVGMAGISGPDQESENELVVTAAEESMKQFLALAPRLAQ